MARVLGLLACALFLFSGCRDCRPAAPLVVEENAAPTLVFSAPTSDVFLTLGGTVRIAYADNDPDDEAHTDLFADRDGDPSTTGDRIPIDLGRAERDGAPQQLDWDTSGIPPGTYRIVAVTTDGTHTVVTVASGSVVIGALLNYYDIASHISATKGKVELASFGQDSWCSEGFGALVLDPQTNIRIQLPTDFPLDGTLLEMQFDYTLGNDAYFELKAETGSLIAGSNISGDGNGGSATYTLLVDMTPLADSGSAFVELRNTSSTDTLTVNANYALFAIEAPNSAGIHVADLRPGSPRVIAGSTTANQGSGGGWSGPLPLGYKGGDLVFDVSNIVAGMTRPVAEFNFVREEDAWGRIELYDENDVLIGAYESDGDCCEDAGHTFLIDLSASRNSSRFRLAIDTDMVVSPFLKIQDAADTNATSVLLDIAPGQRDYVSDGWKFGAYDSPADYPTPNGFLGGMWGTTISYETRHWMADPTHAPYGQEGELVVALPAIVASYGNPVLGVVHFAPDADPALDNPEVSGAPGLYPLEFYVANDLGSDIAHVRFEPWDDDIGGILRNHIPLGAYGVGSTLAIRVPAESDRWSFAAFPVFLRVFDSARGSVD